MTNTVDELVVDFLNRNVTITDLFDATFGTIIDCQDAWLSLY